MRKFLLFLCLQAALTACTTMDAAHHPSNGKRAYAAKAPKNKSAWRK